MIRSFDSFIYGQVSNYEYSNPDILNDYQFSATQNNLWEINLLFKDKNKSYKLLETIKYSHESTVREALNLIAIKYSNYCILIYDYKNDCTYVIAINGNIDSLIETENAFENFKDWLLILEVDWPKSNLNRSAKVTPTKSLNDDINRIEKLERLKSDFADENLQQEVSKYYFCSNLHYILNKTFINCN